MKKSFFLILGRLLFIPQVFAKCLKITNSTPKFYIETDFGGMGLGLVSRGLGVTILPYSYSFSALPNVRFISLPYKMNLYATWRKNDNSPMLENVLQLVTEAAGNYIEEE